MSIDIEVYDLKHAEGTKEYHVLFLWNRANNRALTIFNWGRVGAIGEVQVLRGDRAAMLREAAQKVRAKAKRGYAVTNHNLFTSDVSMLDAAIADYYTRLGIDNLTYLLDGTPPDSPGPALLDESSAPASTLSAVSIETAKTNPNWGMF